MNTRTLSDAELVRESLAGQTTAFGEIIDRYKGLVSAVTFNSCGSFQQSEELAHETFVTAWKELRSLREPEKLKAWLCGIARRMGLNHARRSSREGWTSLEQMEERPAEQPLPAEAAITQEEEAIVWHALERLPENYREPLVLYYRQEKSVELVSAALELSPDAVKQRLSRGRKMLEDKVVEMVEGTLRRSAPGRAFTLGVLAALPMFTASVAAATTTAAVGGTTVAKAGLGVSALGMLAGPLAGILGASYGVRAGLNSAQSPRERALIVRQTWQIVIVATAFVIIFGLTTYIGSRLVSRSPVIGISLIAGVPLLYVILLMTLTFRANRALAKVRAEEGRGEAGGNAHSIKEWRSRASFLGLPLVHVKMGRRLDESFKPALGWIAIGDVAVGVLWAGGGIAIGGMSCGGVAVGALALGGAAFGGLALGGFAAGLLGVGGLALGYMAVGGAAIGWKGALGGLAIAHDFAMGGQALAAEANTAAAREALRGMSLMTVGERLLKHSATFSAWIWTPVIFVFAGLLLRKNKPAPSAPNKPI